MGGFGRVMVWSCMVGWSLSHVSVAQLPTVLATAGLDYLVRLDPREFVGEPGHV